MNWEKLIALINLLCEFIYIPNPAKNEKQSTELILC